MTTFSVSPSSGHIPSPPAPAVEPAWWESSDRDLAVPLKNSKQMQEVARIQQQAATLVGLGKTPLSGDQADLFKAQLIRSLLHLYEFDETPASMAPPRALMPQGAGDQPGITATGSNEFFDNLIDLIDMIGGDYLAVYERLIQQYSDAFKAFNEEVMAEMSKWIKGVNDGKEVEMDVVSMRSAIQGVLDKFDNIVLFPIPNADGSLPNASYEDALKWAKALGMPASQIRPGPPAQLMMDLSPMVVMRDNLPRTAPFKLDSAAFQAWQTGFNTQESEMKNQLQMFTSKYSNANSYHDNFNKILSSQLSMFAEMLKGYLNF